MFGRSTGKEAAGGCAANGCTDEAEIAGYCPGHAIDRYKRQTGVDKPDGEKKPKRGWLR